MRRRRFRPYIDTRLSVDLAGDWRACTDAVPRACEVLGTVTIGHETGALAKLNATGCYVRVTEGKVAVLDQARVKTALAAAADGNDRADMVTVDEWERLHAQKGKA